jgi:hypothetical protein
MGNGVIAFLVAISASAWIYSKLIRSTGGNTKNAIVGAGTAGVLVFVLVLIIMSFVPA